MNMGSYPAAAFSNYMNIDSLQSPPPAPPAAAPAAHSNYMNIDMLSRSLEKSISVDNSPASYGGFPRQNSGGGSYGNYMNMPTALSDPSPVPPMRKISAIAQPIYDTPTSHLRAYANVDSKCIAMSVSNPIYGNCGGTAQKLQT